MSESTSAPASVAPVPETAVAPKLDIQARDLLCASFAGQVDATARWDQAVVVPAASARAALQALRDQLGFQILLDITAVDYLSHAQHRGARYAVVYLLQSLPSAARIRVKVWVEEGEETIPSVHDLWRNANWAERETWDQYGIRFVGHPNLKRLLNHHAFVGHPLRKDYPCQRRQRLEVNDPMLDELVARLEQRGLRVLDAEDTSDGEELA